MQLLVGRMYSYLLRMVLNQQILVPYTPLLHSSSRSCHCVPYKQLRQTSLVTSENTATGRSEHFVPHKMRKIHLIYLLQYTAGVANPFDTSYSTLQMWQIFIFSTELPTAAATNNCLIFSPVRVFCK